ncbi:MAG: Hypothetical protein BHV28_01680 [Candidatus Tokpelaia hoelldobleri]|uniref:DUF2848 domain-containing protein n=1 Tax=Candidatus Tokpelaia hoelldobleri TaxID=1902579 RepID=A0A1U9JSR1_9HYPH|nr:MAG: Hypothetical protein BHV28_01680 [Candidatus Tokpelaia hoelldoblerii]
MKTLELDIVDTGKQSRNVQWVLNGGYAGCDTKQVRHHVEELAALGVPAPKTVPTLYPLGGHVVSQAALYQAPHAQTSGEAEWALLLGRDESEHLLVAACDHTDRALEAHGVAWSKQSAPDFIGHVAWRYSDVKDRFADFSLKAWVQNGDKEELIQDGAPALLLPPSYWLERLETAGLAKAGTLLLSGTIPMRPSVNQFADSWRVELTDNQGNISRVAYQVERLPAAWE